MYSNLKDILLTGFLVYLTLQFIASVLDIPNFNLLCERVPYVRDDPRQTRVGKVLGTETPLLWNMLIQQIPSQGRMTEWKEC